MNKRNLHHKFKWVKHLRARYLLILALIFLMISALALRQNNLEVIKLRDQVVKADQTNGDTESALRELRAYIYSHMNTDLSSGSTAISQPIQLKNRYDRLVASAEKKIKKINEQIEKDAKSECQKKYPTGKYNSDRVNCISSYISTHAVTAEDQVPSDLYKFDFVSPRWTPDLAGISMVLGILFAVLAAGLFVSRYFYSHKLK